jgi:[ribosomal protein S5]-alanine N-acetyltransferase
LTAKEQRVNILETQRLVLRRLRMTDLEALYALYRDEELRRYFPEGVLTLEETRRELEWFLEGHPDHPELGLWATIEKESGAFIGRCGLLPWEIEGQREVEVAYLLDKRYWGRGLATEAARAIVRYGFERLNLERLIALIDPQNLASRRVAERIGMRLDREVDGIDGDGIPTLIYSILRLAEPPLQTV